MVQSRVLPAWHISRAATHVTRPLHLPPLISGASVSPQTVELPYAKEFHPSVAQVSSEHAWVTVGAGLGWVGWSVAVVGSGLGCVGWVVALGRKVLVGSTVGLDDGTLVGTRLGASVQL
jgi:hypothetical protein